MSVLVPWSSCSQHQGQPASSEPPRGQIRCAPCSLSPVLSSAAVPTPSWIRMSRVPPARPPPAEKGPESVRLHQDHTCLVPRKEESRVGNAGVRDPGDREIVDQSERRRGWPWDQQGALCGHLWWIGQDRGAQLGRPPLPEAQLCFLWGGGSCVLSGPGRVPCTWPVCGPGSCLLPAPTHGGN